MPEEPEAKGSIASTVQQSNALIRTITSAPADAFLRIAVLAACVMIYILFSRLLDEVRTSTAFQVRDNAEQAERLRQDCRQREEESQKWQAAEREKDRRFHADQADKWRATISGLAAKIEPRSKGLD